MTKVIIFWDYELQQGMDKSMSRIETKYEGVDGRTEFEQTKKILALHKKYNIPAVFATVGVVAESGTLPYHSPEQVKNIAKQGHEIASHSYEHNLVAEMTREQLKESLVKSKKVLEKVSGQKVTTFVPPHNMPFHFCNMAIYRKPGKFPRKSRLSHRTIAKILNEAGYKAIRTYSINPWRKRVQRPRKVNGVLQIPLTVGVGFAEESVKAVEHAKKNNSLAVFCGHPYATKIDCSENIKHLESFLKYLRKEIDASNVEVVLARDLTK